MGSNVLTPIYFRARNRGPIFVGTCVNQNLHPLFIDRGVPECLRSDNGSEFTAQAIGDWLKAIA